MSTPPTGSALAVQLRSTTTPLPEAEVAVEMIDPIATLPSSAAPACESVSCSIVVLRTSLVLKRDPDPRAVSLFTSAWMARKFEAVGDL